MTAKFKVYHQTLTRHDNLGVVADSVEYLNVKFDFTSDWDGLTKNIVLSRDGNDTYTDFIVDDEYVIPSQMIQYPCFTMSLFGVGGGKRITTNEIRVQVAKSGYKQGVTPPDPEPDVYGQIVDMIGKQAYDSKLAESYTHGGTGEREGEETDNALYYKNQTQDIMDDTAEIKDSIDTGESGRVEAESQRNEAENVRELAEIDRESAEGIRQDNEQSREDSETERTNAETERVINEQQREESEESRNLAETGRETNETARQSSESGRNAAELTRQQNEAQRIDNENNRLALINSKADKLIDYIPGNILISDSAGNISDSGYHINVLNDNYKRYGVSGVGGMNHTLTRLWNSVDLTANAGTDTTAPINDFDDLPPFNRKKCVGYWIDGGGKAKFIVQAYEGDPDFAEDGTKGDYVAVEVSPFWYYQDDFSQHNPEQISGTLGVSPTPVPGWQPHKICLNDDGSIRQKTYLPCYALAQKDGKAVSLPGLENVFGHYKGLWDIARTYGDVEAAKHAILEPIHVRHYEWLLFTIEYATTNCQSVMNGAVALPYSNSTIYQATVATIGETDNNKFILPNSGAAPYVVGQVLAMGAAAYDETHKRIIVAIEDYDADNKTLVFDGEALDIPVGYWSNSRPYRTGTCNTVLTPTGSPVSNTNGKYPMRYRYRENIWGNQYSTCGDLIAKRIGDGTPESPYFIEWYYLIDPTYYPSSTSKPDDVDLSSGAWIKLGQTSIYQNGYIRQIAMDKRYPHVITPVVSSGASSVTFYCDYVYHENTLIIRAVRIGGNATNGADAGVLIFYANLAPSTSAWSFGGGLYFLQ